jgi:hypothetical protein
MVPAKHLMAVSAAMDRVPAFPRAPDVLRMVGTTSRYRPSVAWTGAHDLGERDELRVRPFSLMRVEGP